MKRLVSLVAGVALASLSVGVSARDPGGHGGGFHGGGFRGGAYRGGAVRGGFADYRGGYRGYGYNRGGYGFRYGFGFSFFYGAGFGYYGDPWFWGYPGYGYYGYPSYSVTSPAPAVPQPAWETAIQNGAPQNDASASPTAPSGQACGHWVWDQTTSKYHWATDGCAPARQ